jgi:hypothetical protein
MPHLFRYLSSHIAVAVIVVGAAVSIPGSYPGASAERKTFRIRQDAPVLVRVDIASPGLSHADMLAFEATIRSDDGTAGILRGILTTVDIPDGAGDLLEDRIGQLVFDLGDSNMLVVAGASVYPHQSVEMATNNAQIRAVIGGTGAFIGARGQVTTVRTDDGGYDHSFELLE